MALVVLDDVGARDLLAVIRAAESVLRRDAMRLPRSVEELRSALSGGSQEVSAGLTRPFRGSAAEIADDDGMAPTPLILTKRAAAQRLGVSESTLKRLIRSGDVPTVRVLSEDRIRTADLDEYAANLVAERGAA